MGRKPVNKKRKSDPIRQLRWAEAAWQYFQDHGLQQPKMDQVATALGISKATLYKYFRTKDELVEASLGWKLARLRYFEELLVQEGLSYFERYFDSLRYVSKELAGISNRYLSELERHYPKSWKAIEEFHIDCLRIVTDFYELGMNEGKLNQKLKLKVLVAQDELWFNALADGAFLERYGMSLEEAFEQYYLLKLNGMLPDSEPRVESGDIMQR